MNTLFDDFDAEFEEPAKPALRPSKSFLEKTEEEFTKTLFKADEYMDALDDRMVDHLKNNTPLGPGLASHITKAPIEPNNTSMPQGLKEAQELNGVKDHGLGIMKPLDQRPIVAGNFISVGNVVIFQATEAGAFRIIDPYNVTPTIKDLLDRRFPNSFYCGDNPKGPTVYETKKTEVEKEPEASDAEINEAYEKYLKENKGHVSFKMFKKNLYRTYDINEVKKQSMEAWAKVTEELTINPNVDPSMWKTNLEVMDIISTVTEESSDNLKKIWDDPSSQGVKGTFGNDWIKGLEGMEFGKQQEPTGFDIEPEPDDNTKADLFTQDTWNKVAETAKDADKLPAPFSYPDRKNRPENTYYGSQATAESESMIKALRETPVTYVDAEKKPVHINDIVVHNKTTSVIPPRGGRAWIGIDPGKDGGIVVVDETSTIVEKLIIPKIGDDVDPLELYNFLDTMNYHYTATVVLEDVHSLFGMAAATNFSMGHTLGIIEGIIAACQIRKVKVAPKTWQKAIWEKSDMEYKPLQPDKKKASTDTKQTSMKAAHRLFPKDDFRKSARSKNDHDGICDAACLAEYGRRNNF